MDDFLSESKQRLDHVTTLQVKKTRLISIKTQIFTLIFKLNIQKEIEYVFSEKLTILDVCHEYERIFTENFKRLGASQSVQPPESSSSSTEFLNNVLADLSLDL